MLVYRKVLKNTSTVQRFSGLLFFWKTFSTAKIVETIQFNVLLYNIFQKGWNHQLV